MLHVCPIERGTYWLIAVPNSSSRWLCLYFLIFSHYICGKKSRRVMGLSPQDGSKGAKHPYTAIYLKVSKIVENVIQNLRENY
jgi:hypothetical protein